MLDQLANYTRPRAQSIKTFNFFTSLLEDCKFTCKNVFTLLTLLELFDLNIDRYCSTRMFLHYNDFNKIDTSYIASSRCEKMALVCRIIKLFRYPFRELVLKHIWFGLNLETFNYTRRISLIFERENKQKLLSLIK